MTTLYEGGAIKKRPTGKELIAEALLRTDPVRNQIMNQIQDACTHEHSHIPVLRGGVEASMCCGCSRTAGEQALRKIELDKVKPTRFTL